MIYFEDKGHKYFSDNNEKYTSVSELCARYKNPFDSEFWSNYKALESLVPNFKKVIAQYPSEKEAVRLLLKEFQGFSKFETKKKEILAEWSKTNKDSINKGNLYHKDAEKMAYIRKVIENPFTKTAAKVITLPKHEKFSNVSSGTTLFDLEDGFYPELLLWNDEYKLAGQSDKVYITTIKGKRYVDIDDYKTNKSIKKHGFKGKKMLPPLNDLQDCNYIHYALAISLYAWMLEQFGFTVRHTGFQHYNVMYKTPYMLEHVEKILLNHKERIREI